MKRRWVAEAVNAADGHHRNPAVLRHRRRAQARVPGNVAAGAAAASGGGEVVAGPDDAEEVARV